MKKATLLLLVIFALSASGCAFFQPTKIYPIEDDDIYSTPAGASVVIPAGTKILDDKGNVIEEWPDGKTTLVKKSGWTMSDFYLQEVVDAKVKRPKR